MKYNSKIVFLNHTFWNQTLHLLKFQYQVCPQFSTGGSSSHSRPRHVPLATVIKLKHTYWSRLANSPCNTLTPELAECAGPGLSLGCGSGSSWM